MFRKRLDKAMDLIVEGIDNGNVRLILRETAEFTNAFNELKGSISDFMGLIGEVGLEGLKEPYVNINKLVVKAEQGLDELPEEWSWDDQIEALKKPTGESPPETLVSQISLSHDTNVNACKDAIITIAQFLEAQGKGLFKVGSAGLNMEESFKKALRVDSFRLAQLAVDDYLYALVGVEKTNNETEDKNAVKEAWKGVWNPQNKEGADKDWEQFQDRLEAMATGIPKLYKSCVDVIKAGKPSKEFQQEAPKEGLVASLLGGLFGGGSPTNIDPKKVMGSGPEDPKGLLGMSFESLSALVVGLLKMSGAATQASAGALQAIQDNQERIAEEVWGEEVRDVLLKGYGEKPKDPQDVKGMPKTAKAMGAFEEILGKDKSPKIDDIKKIEDLTKKLASLKKYKFESQDEVDELFKILGIEVEEEAEEEVDRPSPLDVIVDFDNLEDDDKEAWIDSAEEAKAIDGSGEANPENTPEKVKSIVDLIVDELDDEQEEDLSDSLLPPEEEEGDKDPKETFRRWGVLAGIIKG